MPYTDVDSVRAVLAPDGVTDGTAASLSDEVFTETIERVSNRVDTYLARRYRLPIPEPVPSILKDLATDVAAYDLTLSYYKSTDISDMDPVVRRYRDARAILTQLSSGLMNLNMPGDGDWVTDDPIVINPSEYRPCSPGPGFEVKVIREFGPWEYRYGS
jgi:phage gp36-like protein